MVGVVMVVVVVVVAPLHYTVKQMGKFSSISL